jgi:hypothetical protein
VPLESLGGPEARLLDALPVRLRPLVTVALNTGDARGELQALRWSDVALPTVKKSDFRSSPDREDPGKRMWRARALVASKQFASGIISSRDGDASASQRFVVMMPFLVVSDPDTTSCAVDPRGSQRGHVDEAVQAPRLRGARRREEPAA